jgi:hypothetical protein
VAERSTPVYVMLIESMHWCWTRYSLQRLERGRMGADLHTSRVGAFAAGVDAGEFA